MNRRDFLQMGMMAGMWAAAGRNAWAEAAASPDVGKIWGGTAAIWSLRT